MGLPRRAAPALAALGRRKFLQFDFTTTAINALLSLGAVPKTSASFANLQLHAYFHDRFSVLLVLISRRTTFVSAVRRGEKERDFATQDSSVLMGDCGLCSFVVVCHVDSAQILEFSPRIAPARFHAKPGKKDGLNRRDTRLPEIVRRLQRATMFRPALWEPAKQFPENSHNPMRD
jgi:hypothetical protein